MVRRGRPEDVQALGELSDRVFRPNLVPGTGMPKEFSNLFHADNASHLYFVADDQGQPISLVATYQSELMAGGARISAISIGSVATLAEHRGHGYATQILEQVMQDARAHHAVMLVSGARNLYLRLGCVPFGQLMHAEWAIENVKVSELAGFREVKDFGQDAAPLHRIYQREPYRYLRTPEEMISFLHATKAPRYRARPQATRVFAAEADGNVVAYVVAAPSRDGRRIDLLEWAGDRARMAGLAHFAGRAMGVGTVELLLQPDDLTFRSLLAERGITLRPEANEGTILILNLKRLVDEVNPLLRERTGHILQVLSAEEDQWALEWSGRGRVQVPDLPEQRDRGSVATWFFTGHGLNLALPDTAGLNFV